MRFLFRLDLQTASNYSSAEFFFWNLVFCNQTRALLQASTSDGSFCRALGAKKVKSQVAVSCSSARVFFSPFACGAMDPAQDGRSTISRAVQQQTAWIHSNPNTVFRPLLLFEQPSTSTTWAGVHVFLSLHRMRLNDQNLQCQGSQFRPQFCQATTVGLGSDGCECDHVIQLVPGGAGSVYHLKWMSESPIGRLFTEIE